jgi:hypothetical protein
MAFNIPFVDYEVYLLTKDYNNSGNKLSQQVRIELVSILNKQIAFDNQKTTMLNKPYI